MGQRVLGFGESDGKMYNKIQKDQSQITIINISDKIIKFHCMSQQFLTFPFICIAKPNNTLIIFVPVMVPMAYSIGTRS